MPNRKRQIMTVYVGFSNSNMLQLRTEGEEDRFSSADGLWFSSASGENMKYLTRAGQAILEEVFKKNAITRHGLYLDKIFVASAWQMNVFRKTYFIGEREAVVFLSAFEKAFGKRIRRATEPRALGSVFF